MNGASEFAISASAAALAHVLHHPLYTLKSQMMFYGPEFRFKAFVYSAWKQPAGFLYRGLVSRTLGIMPEKAFKMQGWIIVGRYMEKHFESPTLSKWLVAGAAAGAATTLIGCPSERAMVLAQIQNKRFFAVMRQEGLKGLYAGWRCTLYRDISFNSAFFASRELFVLLWKRQVGLDPGAHWRVALGIPAGCLASVIACPFDVVKTRVQGRELKEMTHKSCYSIMKEIVKREGVRYLFKGLLPRLIAVPSMMSVFYVINEELERLVLLHAS